MTLSSFYQVLYRIFIRISDFGVGCCSILSRSIVRYGEDVDCKCIDVACDGSRTLNHKEGIIEDV